MSRKKQQGVQQTEVKEVLKDHRSLMSQTNEDPQSEQGRQSNDGRTSEAPPHQVRQDESHGSFSIERNGEMINKPVNDGGATCVRPNQKAQEQEWLESGNQKKHNVLSQECIQCNLGRRGLH